MQGYITTGLTSLIPQSKTDKKDVIKLDIIHPFLNPATAEVDIRRIKKIVPSSRKPNQLPVIVLTSLVISHILFAKVKLSRLYKSVILKLPLHDC